MFETISQRPPRTGGRALMAASVVTMLGYFGLPWWAGWPAAVALQLEERWWSVFERGVTWQVVAFFVAMTINIVVWAVAIWIVTALIRRAAVRMRQRDRARDPKNARGAPRPE
jgi:hypothetical protein